MKILLGFIIVMATIYLPIYTTLGVGAAYVGGGLILATLSAISDMDERK